VGGITLGISSLAFAILMLPNLTTTLILVAMVINGYTAGTKLQVTSYLISAYGGMRHFGAIFGVIASLIAAGSGLGPVLAGLTYDTFGSYNPFLVAGIIGSLFCGALIASLRDYPRWNQGSVSSQ
jgi:MFS family permease